MALQRFWLAIVILLGLQMTAAAPSIARYATPRHHLAKTLKSGQFKTLVEDFILSYQRQVHTISVSRDQLHQSHRLVISSLGALEGTLTINGEEVHTLSQGTTTLNLSPHLRAGDTTVLVMGHYDPISQPVSIRFQGPDTDLGHQLTQTGLLSYQLNLQVE